MALSARLQELRKKHEDLSQQVETEQKSPGTDPFRITEMKKQKLRLKEEISRLQGA